MYTSMAETEGNMSHFQELIRFGFSPTMLYPEAFEEEDTLYAAWLAAEQLPEFEALESFLPHDPSKRKRMLAVLKRTGKVLNYNTPGYFQLEGEFNLCSDDPGFRRNAFEEMRRHLSYAGEAGSPLFVVTGCPDRGEEMRPELKKRYGEVFMKLCEEAEQYSIRILLEPIERHRFKRLIWGPTAECAAFIREMRANGAGNSGLMMDIAHLPLMNEEIPDAIRDCGEIGFEHVHLGNAVFEESDRFYGHTHPPLGIIHGLFSQEDLEHQFRLLMECGLIGEEKPRASISLEVRPYPGVSELTSIRAMYEQCVSAFYANGAPVQGS